MAWWLLQTVALSAILAAVVRFATLSHRVGPVARHALWTLVLIKLITPPLVAWPWTVDVSRLTATPSPGIERSTSAHATIELVPIAAPAANTSIDVPSPTTPLRTAWRLQRGDIIAATVVLWMAGAFVFLLVQAVRIRSMVARVRRSTACPELQSRVDAVAARLNLKPVSVRILFDLHAPAIWSMRRPQLLWPASWQDESGTPFEPFIVHELAHVKRRDHWVGWLELVAGTLWWWNPLYWYVRCHVRANAELACDAWVAGERPQDRRRYAESLLALHASQPGAPTSALMAGALSGNRRFLERRLAVIMRDREPLYLSRLAVVSLVLAMACVLPAVAQQRADRTDAFGADGAVLPPMPARLASIALPDVHATLDDLGAQAQTLPPDAQTLADRFAREQTEALRQAEARIAQQRADLIKQLQALQDAHTRAGRLDEAVAVRDRIRQLMATGSDVNSVSIDAANGKVTSVSSYPILPDPGTLEGYRDLVGDTLFFTVTGRTSGPLWGTHIYTDDSRLATAAVHAGILKPGESGVVRVVLLPGLSSYEASRQNDVRSESWERWDGSYRVLPPTVSQPASGTIARGRAYSNVPMQLSGDIRFSTVDGNSLTYYRNPSRSFSVQGTTTPQQLELLLHADSPESLERLLAQASATARFRFYENAAAERLRALFAGETPTIEIEIEGTTQGGVWGSDIYTNDSSVPAAAVHAGVLKPGERGTVKVTALPGQESYRGEMRNGVTSQPWESWGGSFRIERAEK